MNEIVTFVQFDASNEAQHSDAARIHYIYILSAKTLFFLPNLIQNFNYWDVLDDILFWTQRDPLDEVIKTQKMILTRVPSMGAGT